MADRRMLSTLIAEDEELNRLSIEAHLLFLMIIPHLDRDGLITAHPRLLHSRATPLRTELIDRTGELIEELLRAGLVIRYGTDKPVLFLRAFRRHQVGMHYEDEKPSKHPPPPGYSRCSAGLLPDDPDEAQRLAACFDPRSNYAKALLATTSRDGRDYIATTSRDGRVSRSITNQMGTNDDDDDQSISPTPLGYRIGGDARGGSLTNILQNMQRSQVEAMTLMLSDLVGIQNDFSGKFNTYIKTLEELPLIMWLQWIWFYYHHPEATTAIRSVSAVIRAHIKKKEEPYLPPQMQQSLLDTIDKYTLQPARQP